MRGGEAPPITTIQNTQASPEFWALPQVIPTSNPISKMLHVIAQPLNCKVQCKHVLQLCGIEFLQFINSITVVQFVQIAFAELPTWEAAFGAEEAGPVNRPGPVKAYA